MAFDVRSAIAAKWTRASIDLQAQRRDDRGPARELVFHIAAVCFGVEVTVRLERAGDQQLPVLMAWAPVGANLCRWNAGFLTVLLPKPRPWGAQWGAAVQEAPAPGASSDDCICGVCFTPMSLRAPAPSALASAAVSLRAVNILSRNGAAGLLAIDGS